MDIKRLAYAVWKFFAKALLCCVLFICSMFVLFMMIKHSSLLGSSVAAAWVQAVGSVGAIWAAISVFRKQVNYDRKKKMEDDSDRHQYTYDLTYQAYQTACMFELAAENFHSVMLFRLNFCGRVLSLLKLQVGALRAVHVNDLKTSLLLPLHLELLSALASLSDRVESIRSIDLPDDEVTVTLICISQDAFWVKSMWEGYKRHWDDRRYV
jgi:hypothetical protein